MYYRCSICLCSLICEKAISATECGHVFHEQCLRNCLEYSVICPVCRSECMDARRLYLSVSVNDSIESEVEALRQEVGLKTEGIRSLENAITGMLTAYNEQLQENGRLVTARTELAANLLNSENVVTNLTCELQIVRDQLYDVRNTLLIWQEENKILESSYRKLKNRYGILENELKNFQSKGGMSDSTISPALALVTATASASNMLSSPSKSEPNTEPRSSQGKGSVKVVVPKQGGRAFLRYLINTEKKPSSTKRRKINIHLEVPTATSQRKRKFKEAAQQRPLENDEAMNRE